MRDIVVMPDVQAPLHDRKLVAKFIRFLKDYQPHTLAQVGDFTDSTQISRWAKGLKLEYAGGLQDGFDQAQNILAKIREVHDGKFVMVRSNHDDRLQTYLNRYGPGIEDLRDLTFEHQLGLKKHRVDFSHKIVDLAPGWIMAHGDEGGLSSVAGQTAFKLMDKHTGMSVVCGHSHRAGITSVSKGYNGKISTKHAVEVGHFMDLREATYLGTGAGNWQQAFAILHVSGELVFPELVSVIDGKFQVEGKVY
jgi:UDP-2,3-diacylglucosamine pyrophosphatase LpxH